ncbi:tetratricopeptide repeat protein [Flavobacterium supellecticarium]|uniref:Tetratricopeptide repeat protein n=1 Tax=Flavobacterium supellecticarium TaxID=2565924 RepID=A0A4S3ZRQ4_9FLAO|nr:tetratricopeptide repeat protein [Flavobacterium supellecticarium]THF48197.1 tetratricopeptide repeat protein [Flavobacterium supellecticarium]
MKNFFSYIALLCSVFVFAQNEQLAQNYFDRGEFEKAMVIYEDLLKTQPNNYQYFQKQVACYQQLKQYAKAEEMIRIRIDRFKQNNLYVELGYNYQLQKEMDKANKAYQKALDIIKENPNNVYGVASLFEQKVLLEQALKAYDLGTAGNPSFNFDYQIALLQGQLGNLELMVDKLLDYAYRNPQNAPLVQSQLARFMMEDTQESFNTNLRKALLIRTQKTQDIFWNQFLSWFFVQQKEYGKAFIQEKAIFKRNPDNFYTIINLAKLAVQEQENDTAKEILDFILLNTQDLDLQMEAHYQLLTMDIEKATPKEYPLIQEKINLLLKQYGISPYSLRLQVLKAHFEAFYLKQFETARQILTNALDLPLNNYQKADVKMELADVLLLDEKFNQAIIYYAQIEDDLKNDEVGHEASLKMAKASYFKGDFDWAQQQFKVLKASSSQLIANDALELFLLINDHTTQDSTRVALKKFAKADFLLYQNKTDEALNGFRTLLKEHKGQSVEDETLLKIGRILEEKKEYAEALKVYQEIIEKHAEGIYVDEALFFSAEIYRKDLPDIEKAKALYEKVIFNHQDSIYYVDARNNYRKLRGDNNL